MCIIKRRKPVKQHHPDNKNDHFIKVNGISVRLNGNSNEQFLRLKKHLTKKLGISVSKTQVMKHAIAIADQIYQQDIGIGSY